jgi:hypothetical protein
MDLSQAALRIDLLNIVQGMAICTPFSPPCNALSTAKSTNEQKLFVLHIENIEETI